jgi:integrase
MPQRIFLSYAPVDRAFAVLWESKLASQGYTVFKTTSGTPGAVKWQQEIERAVKTSLAVIVLVSPQSAESQRVNYECGLARYSNRPLIPVLIQFVDALPWYLKDLQIEDATMDIDAAFGRVLRSLPKPALGLTLGEARDAYLQRATLKSPHTMAAYRRAIELLLEFLADRSAVHGLPVQKTPYTVADEIPLAALTKDDAPILLHFAQWMLSTGTGQSGDKRPYKPSTVELRISGVQNWLQYLDDHGWLPPEFQLARAKRIVQDELQGRTHQFTPPQPPDHIEEVIYYYDALELPPHLRKPEAAPEHLQRWEVTRLRNRALLHVLAETGGRISEVLSLNLADFPARYLEKGEVLRVEVTGKGGHTYYLRFLDSLPAIRAYIEARGANLRSSLRGDIPLFVSHDPHYDGKRMSRVVAWRVVQRAARALGVRSITPHDFRHWRATQLLNDGHPLDVVQDYLGHRSVETTRAYYARTDPLRVDDAAKNTRLPDPDDPS